MDEVGQYKYLMSPTNSVTVILIDRNRFDTHSKYPVQSEFVIVLPITHLVPQSTILDSNLRQVYLLLKYKKNRKHSFMLQAA